MLVYQNHNHNVRPNRLKINRTCIPWLYDLAQESVPSTSWRHSQCASTPHSQNCQSWSSWHIGRMQGTYSEITKKYFQKWFPTFQRPYFESLNCESINVKAWHIKMIHFWIFFVLNLGSGPKGLQTSYVNPPIIRRLLRGVGTRIMKLHCSWTKMWGP